MGFKKWKTNERYRFFQLRKPFSSSVTTQHTVSEHFLQLRCTVLDELSRSAHLVDRKIQLDLLPRLQRLFRLFMQISNSRGPKRKKGNLLLYKFLSDVALWVTAEKSGAFLKDVFSLPGWLLLSLSLFILFSWA